MKVRRRGFNADVPSMCMGDIAFNLLIFFVILARAQDDSHLKWIPASTDETEDAGHPRASIVVDVKNKLYLNGQPISIKQLEGRLNELLGNSQGEDRKVQLKIHRDTKASRFEPIIKAVSAAGAKYFHILKEEKEK